MRILFAIKGLYQAAGGAERVISDVCSYLADQRGHEVYLLTFDQPGAVPFYPLSRNVGLIQLGIGDARAPTSLLILLHRIRMLRKKVREMAPDVVVAFMYSMFVPMALALVRSGIPLVASEHIVIDYYRARRKQFALFLAAVPFIRLITVLSPLVASKYPKWIRQKMVVVTNPVSPTFQQLVTPSDEKEPRTILSVGRFSSRKDHSTLVAAFASIANEFPDWSLRVVGDGVLRPTVQREIERMGLAHRISLPGIVMDISREMANASFFALASRYESFGLVFVEAMACGKASVAFADCQGANEVIDDNVTGVLVKVHGHDRIAAMAHGLRYLMKAEQQRRSMGQRARARVFERFSIDHVCERWEAILGNAGPIRVRP